MSSELVWQITKKHNAMIVSRSGVSFDSDPLNVTNVPSKKNSGLVNAKAAGVVASKTGGAVLLVKNRRAGAQKPAKQVTSYLLKKGVRRGAKTVKAEVRADLVPATLARLTRIAKTSKVAKPAAK